MKPSSVLQVGFTDLEGARFNGHELHKELLRLGIESSHLVWRKTSDDVGTKAIDSTLNGISQRFLSRVESQLSVQSLLYPYGFQLAVEKLFHRAAVVHYHLLHKEFFSLASLPILTRLRPSVWTLHDPWAMTGHCVHPGECDRWKIGCGSCPHLQSSLPMRCDNTAMMWRIKKQMYAASDFDVVVASKWMYDMAVSSPLLSDCRIHHIPFGIDLGIFKPADDQRALRKDLRIPSDNFVFLCRAFPGEHKGLEYVIEAFERLWKARAQDAHKSLPITILALNQKGHFDRFLQRYHVLELGWIDDPQQFARVLQACDVFLMPSIAESFGMMAIEAMACQKPVIVFDGTALPGVTFAPTGAMSVPSRDVPLLASAMQKLMDNEELRQSLGREARKLAVEHYDFRVHVEKLLALYGDVIERRNPRKTLIARELRESKETEMARSGP